MGVLTCHPCCQKREEEDIIFSSRGVKTGDNVFTFNEVSSKFYTSKTNCNLQESELNEAKNLLEYNIKQKGEFFENKSIAEILEELNPMANRINLPKEIINDISLFYIKEPMVKFADGEIYEGGWNLDFQRHGYGISVNKDGNVFKGLWENDNFGRYGAFIENNGNYYIGELSQGKEKGKGELFIKNKMKYKGEFNDDLPNGQGTLENFKDNSIYKGNVINGIKEGYGELKLGDGTIYKGEFKEDKFCGKGIIIFPNGRKYEGEFKNNKINGNGIFYWEDGKKYIGNYNDNIKQGYGKLLWNENKYYEGQWLNNKPHGEGMYYLNGKLLKGKFRFGKIISQNKELQ